MLSLEKSNLNLPLMKRNVMTVSDIYEAITTPKRRFLYQQQKN